MSRLYTFEGFSAFNALETKLSLSALSVAVRVHADDLPPPDSEPDPGAPDTHDPIVYPTLPSGGPVGPG
ncbi:MAG: hypothetical protein U0790_23740 [Isosphaeraceae bacterium]